MGMCYGTRLDSSTPSTLCGGIIDMVEYKFFLWVFLAGEFIEHKSLIGV